MSEEHFRCCSKVKRPGGDKWLARHLALLIQPKCEAAVLWESFDLYAPCAQHPKPGERLCVNHGGPLQDHKAAKVWIRKNIRRLRITIMEDLKSWATSPDARIVGPAAYAVLQNMIAADDKEALNELLPSTLPRYFCGMCGGKYA